MSKHTPGPWTAIQHSVGSHDITAVGADSFDGPFILATVNSVASSSGQALATARLIAAAPEQHALLVRFEQVLGAWMNTHDDAELCHLISVSLPTMLKETKAIIAKAEPKS